jgi:hypothetical protein
MSALAERACAARWLSSRVPAYLSDEEACGLWGQLSLELEDARSEGAEVLMILNWRKDVEAFIATRLLHSPLEAAQ